MLWTQASRVIQTVKRPSSLTDSLTDSLTFKSTQAALAFPAKMSFHSFPLFFCSLILYLFHIWGHLWRPPVLCSQAWHWRHCGHRWTGWYCCPLVSFTDEWLSQTLSRCSRRETHNHCFPYHLWDVLLVCVLGKIMNIFVFVCLCMFLSLYVSWITTFKTICLVDVLVVARLLPMCSEGSVILW